MAAACAAISILRVIIPILSARVLEPKVGILAGENRGRIATSRHIGATRFVSARVWSCGDEGEGRSPGCGG